MAKKKPILGSVNLDYVGDNFEWYAIVTMFNYEEFYVDNLIQGINGTSLESLVDEFFVPITKTLVNSYQVYTQGQKPKITKSKDAYSFYVFIRCKLTEELWCFLRETTGVAVIPTVGGIPRAVSEEEIYKTKCNTLPQGFLKDFPKNKNGSPLKELRDQYNKYEALPWKVRSGFVTLTDEELMERYERMSQFVNPKH
jgi:transcription antitermination factor NusG